MSPNCDMDLTVTIGYPKSVPDIGNVVQCYDVGVTCR
jgi:hypothetical protein